MYTCAILELEKQIQENGQGLLANHHCLMVSFKLVSSEKCCLNINKQCGGQMLRKDAQGWPLASTYMSMHPNSSPPPWVREAPTESSEEEEERGNDPPKWIDSAAF